MKESTGVASETPHTSTATRFPDKGSGSPNGICTNLMSRRPSVKSTNVGAVQLRMLRGLLPIPDDPTGGIVRKNVDNPYAGRYPDRIGD